MEVTLLGITIDVIPPKPRNALLGMLCTVLPKLTVVNGLPEKGCDEKLEKLVQLVALKLTVVKELQLLKALLLMEVTPL
jgi:hypothetical protein